MLYLRHYRHCCVAKIETTSRKPCKSLMFFVLTIQTYKSFRFFKLCNRCGLWERKNCTERTTSSGSHTSPMKKYVLRSPYSTKGKELEWHVMEQAEALITVFSFLQPTENFDNVVPRTAHLCRNTLVIQLGGCLLLTKSWCNSTNEVAIVN